MADKQVVIIDTGCANITSVRCAFERISNNVIVSRDPQTIVNASHVVLPGVGTAGAAMEKLAQFELIELVQQLRQPVLGICLGMQLLTQASDERNVDCLGLVDAKVSPLEKRAELPLPHMGWNKLIQLTGPLFEGVDEGSYVYFVHSFAVPVGQYTLAQCDYGQAFSASIRQRNYYGVQFHPERSGQVGAQILRNFLSIESTNTQERQA
ncbi:imidazole glycerol phosphate synthase subunit HisH [Alteromonadales bacterium alter-6D02]|nr:imidazole glycerol phosphate synthase subunit HisH [Alteromonadales bacterium alter-6D02]